MPTKQLRIAITPSPELRAALEEFAEAVEKPVATVVVDLLGEMVPQISGLAKFARHSKAGQKAQAKRALQHALGDGMAELLTQMQPDLKGVKK